MEGEGFFKVSILIVGLFFMRFLLLPSIVDAQEFQRVLEVRMSSSLTEECVLTKEESGILVVTLYTGCLNLKESNENSLINNEINSSDVTESVVVSEVNTNLEPVSVVGVIQESVRSFALGDVVISEIMPNPLQGGVEWVELYNRTDVAVDLTGWSLFEGGGNKVILSGSLLPAAYLSFDRKSLNNGGDIIILKDSQGNIIDKMSYGDWDDGFLNDNAPVPEKGFVLVKEIITKYTAPFVLSMTPTRDLANWIKMPIVEENNKTQEEIDTKVESEISKDNSIPVSEELDLKVVSSNIEMVVPDTVLQVPIVEKKQEVFDSGSIIINEILPDPKDSDASGEFIEIYNTLKESVTLDNWTIEDGESKKIFTIKETFIEPSSYKVFYRTDTGIILNNDSDSIVLRDLRGEIMDRAQYNDVFVGQSYQRNNDLSWKWSSESTPGMKNIFSSMLSVEQFSGTIKEKKYIPVEIISIRDHDLGSFVEFEGVVSVSPGIFDDDIFYVQNKDGTSGIQVNFSARDTPSVKEGDRVLIRGELGTRYKEFRIKVSKSSDVHILEKKYELNVSVLSTDKINSTTEGLFVKVTGDVVEPKKKSFYLIDDLGESRVGFIDSFPNMFNEGDKVSVAGIVRRGGDEYQIIPRYDYDIEKLAVSFPNEFYVPSNLSITKTVENRKNIFIVGFVLILVCFILSISFFLHRKISFRSIFSLKK